MNCDSHIGQQTKHKKKILSAPLKKELQLPSKNEEKQKTK